MYYFGCIQRAGHYMFDEHLRSPYKNECPWNPDHGEVDGKLQPHRLGCDKRNYCGCGNLPEGQALIHHKNGWTALAFWDRSVDGRGGCNSNFFAEGDYDFAQMVALAKAKFPSIWKRYAFEVVGAG